MRMLRLNPSTRKTASVFAGPVMVGPAVAVVFVCAWALASGANLAALLFSTANGRGALMLCTALAGLFACAALATSFSLCDENPRLRRKTVRALAYGRIRSRGRR